MLRLTLISLGLILAICANLGAQEPTYTLVIRDHRFQPAEIEVPAGQKITLLVKNEDTTPEEFESHQLKREKVIPGGKEITLSVGPLKAGRYEFFGEFNPKTARGYIVAK
jgi:hypothetical protein